MNTNRNLSAVKLQTEVEVLARLLDQTSDGPRLCNQALFVAQTKGRLLHELNHNPISEDYMELVKADGILKKFVERIGNTSP